MAKKIVEVKLLLDLANTIRVLTQTIESYKSMVVGNVNFHNQILKTEKQERQLTKTLLDQLQASPEFKEEKIEKVEEKKGNQ